MDTFLLGLEIYFQEEEKMQNVENVNAAPAAGKARLVSRKKVRTLVMSALMGAVAFVLMYFNFGVPVLSPFAEFDASALPEIIGGFILGPVGAIEIIVVKIVLILVFKGTSSMFTGEVQNFLLSVAYVLPAIMYYRGHKTKKGAIIGLVLGTVISVVVAIFTNVYLIFPAYIRLYGMSWESILDICAAANPWIHSIPTFVAFSVVPFNVVSRVVTSLITVLVYKKISGPIKKFLI
jgi:riboflavin transporter FmnP